MSLISLKINNRSIQVEKGTTILDAAKLLNIKIPALCHLNIQDGKTINHPGSCRVCVVEIEGRKKLSPACSTPVEEGMVVKTNSIRAIKARRTIVELLLSDHPQECLLCEKSTICELQKLAAELGIHKVKYKGEIARYKKDDSSYSIIRDFDKCILCRRCETICNEVQTVGVLSAVNRGFKTIIGPAFESPMMETKCTFCGQCVAVCPTGALTEVNYISKVWDVLNNKNKVVIVQTAPSVRAALGEGFGLEPGTIVTGKMVSSLRALGFDKVFDTDFAADLTIVEEAIEFINRYKNGGTLPLLTSCCPGWIKFIEHNFSNFLDIPSTCKSPQQMFGTIAKTYFAKKMNISPKDIVVVSVMPCLAKKYEASREEMMTNGIKDVDIVITTRELIKMINEAGIDFNSLPEEEFDNPLGVSTGASTIFGTSGGVMEAALRTAYEWLTGTSIPNLEFKTVRGLEGLKEASIKINNDCINVAIASGLGNARKLLESIESGKSKYHMIEIMACPGGCIGGGGQPYIHGNTDILEKRMQGLYKEDKSKSLRKSHDNPYINTLYKEFLGNPGGEKAHKLLHTTYIKRD